MKNRLYTGFLIGFVVFWIGFIFLDFWQKHPLYSLALGDFKYINLTIIYIVFGVGLGWFVLNLDKNKPSPFYINWLSIYGLCLLVLLITTFVYDKVAFDGNLLESGGLPFLAFKVLFVSLFTYLTVLFSYAIGAFVGKYFDLRLAPAEWMIIRIGIGIMTLVFLLFLLGIFSLLQQLIILLVLIGFVVLSWEDTLDFVKKTTIAPIQINKKLNWFGFASFFLLMLIISLNFVQIISPFPTGFDSLTLYANLPKLINDHAGLIEGHQPYNWSLFMSLGYIIFKSPEVMLSLSFIAGIFCLPAMYQLGKNWLKMDVNYLLLALLIFYATPSVMHQSYAELKVDLGLLFVYMCILLLFASWLQVFNQKQKAITEDTIDRSEMIHIEDPQKKETEHSKKESSKKKKTKIATAKSNTSTVTKHAYLSSYNTERLFDPYFILIGLLSGFAFGIKLTTLFAFFGIIAGIWYAYNGKNAYLAVFSLSIFGVLLVRLDDIGGLRQYHLGADALKWLMLLVSLGLFALAFMKNKEATIKSIRLSIVYGFFFALPFLPWLTKNYIETRSLDPQTLLNGKKPGPVMNLNILEKNWTESQNK